MNNISFANWIISYSVVIFFSYISSHRSLYSVTKNTSMVVLWFLCAFCAFTSMTNVFIFLLYMGVYFVYIMLLCSFFSRKFSSTILKTNASWRNKVVLFFSSFSFFFFLVNFLRLFKERERVKSTSSFIFIVTYSWLIIVHSVSVQCKSSFSRSSKFGFSHAENLRRLISEKFWSISKYRWLIIFILYRIRLDPMYFWCSISSSVRSCYMRTTIYRWTCHMAISNSSRWTST